MASKIIVNNNSIQILDKSGEKYLCLTDMAKVFGEPNVLILSWMRRKDTIEFIGIWEKIHNPDFKPHEFVGFKNQAGANRFNISPQQWVAATGAIGIESKSGRYGGGTYAHEDIALHFGQWLSPEFSLYVIKEFKRLKQSEAQRESKDWQLSRALSKINYRIHTDAVDKHLIPPHISSKFKWPWFTQEADLLNLAMFGKTASQWRGENPESEGNIRDHASQEQLLVLANLESLNSHLIQEGVPKKDRLLKLNKMAIQQMKSLLGEPATRKLIN